MIQVSPHRQARMGLIAVSDPAATTTDMQHAVIHESFVLYQHHWKTAPRRRTTHLRPLMSMSPWSGSGLSSVTSPTFCLGGDVPQLQKTWCHTTSTPTAKSAGTTWQYLSCMGMDYRRTHLETSTTHPLMRNMHVALANMVTWRHTEAHFCMCILINIAHIIIYCS